MRLTRLSPPTVVEDEDDYDPLEAFMAGVNKQVDVCAYMCVCARIYMCVCVCMCVVVNAQGGCSVFVGVGTQIRTQSQLKREHKPQTTMT